MVSIDYLEEERKKLWLEISQLKNDLRKKSSEHMHEAQQASKKTSEYRNRSRLSEKEIAENLAKSKSNLSEIQHHFEKTSEFYKKISGVNEAAQISSQNIDNLQNKMVLIDKLFENREDIETKLKTLEDKIIEGNDSSNKTSALYSSLVKRKAEFDEIYYEIFGYDEQNEETEETVHINGQKDELEDAYKKVESKVSELGAEISDIKANTSAEFKTTVLSWKTDFESLSKEVKDLLPNALTAGLSHAFSEKSTKETTAGKWSNASFALAIFGLVLVSLIPFILNFYLIAYEEKTLESVITDIPKIAFAILPLYIPFLWLAYSSNKKANLSKRLVEEYTHKEVLSKTFEGLSRQINDIDDTEVSEELRIKLLYNILEVSAENPGKLISDYNTADHPLMDALDKSVRLSDAVERLANIPGFSRLSRILESKSNKLLSKQTEKVVDALDSVTTD